MSKIKEQYHDKIEKEMKDARYRAVHLYMEKKGISLQTYMNLRISNSLKEWFNIIDLMVEFSELQNQTT